MRSRFDEKTLVIAGGPRRSVLIFDPQTYELLGENEGDGAAPTWSRRS
jgi:hypothetical protein